MECKQGVNAFTNYKVYHHCYLLVTQFDLIIIHKHFEHL